MASLDPLLCVGLALFGLLGALSLLTRQTRAVKTGTFSGRERIALTDQHTVQVIEIGGRRLLVGTGPSGAPRVLAELGEVDVLGEAEGLDRGGTIFGRAWGEVLGRLGVEGGR